MRPDDERKKLMIYCKSARSSYADKVKEQVVYNNSSEEELKAIRNEGMFKTLEISNTDIISHIFR